MFIKETLKHFFWKFSPMKFFPFPVAYAKRRLKLHLKCNIFPHYPQNSLFCFCFSFCANVRFLFYIRFSVGFIVRVNLSFMLYCRSPFFLFSVRFRLCRMILGYLPDIDLVYHSKTSHRYFEFVFGKCFI